MEWFSWDMELRRYVKWEPWVKMGISKSTYFRWKKAGKIPDEKPEKKPE